MNELRYTLVADGSSDKALIPILTWLLNHNGIICAIQNNWADLSYLPNKVENLAEKIELSYDLYPCDILFIHRDAERESIEHRKNEISNAIDIVIKKIKTPPYICVIPVRMTEAWLLFDENAIKRAAGNSNSRAKLDLPKINEIESLPDPK